MEQNKARSYFRIKSEYTREASNGDLEKAKTEELAYVTSYTEAEALAYAIAEDLNRNRYSDLNIEIIKTKIETVLFNEILKEDDPILDLTPVYFEEPEENTGVGLYAVKVIFMVENPNTGKIKNTTEIIYTPAESNADAAARVNEHLGQMSTEYVIRDVKFDKAVAIYWDSTTHNQKITADN